jgi:hypothetical protein
MNAYLRFLLGTLSALATTAASCASFEVLCDEPEHEIAMKSCTIKLTGIIQPGDSQKLLRLLRQPLLGGWSYGRLLLDSPGGNVPAAVELSKVVRSALLYTSTARPTRNGGVDERSCISACFLVWVAGAQRLSASFLLPRRSDGTSTIGLHRPYFERGVYELSPTQVAAMQQEAMQLVETYLTRERVPRQLIEKMLSHASTDIYWVGPEDPNISGMSPWFEEMMIARCGFDPARTRDAAAYAAERAMERWSRTGKLEVKPTDSDARERADARREQEYFACQQANQRAAQAALHR